MKTIGGYMFVSKGIEYDYPFIEAIQSLLPICDQIAVTFFTDEDFELFKASFPNDPKIKTCKLDQSRFDESVGKERLSLWQNFTKNMLTTEWQFLLQADEILHENSYDLIRLAVERDDQEAYIVRRFNLWGDCHHYINYPKLTAEGRYGELPCSNHTGRLAKIKYDSWNDGESLDAPFCHDYMETIKTYHMGFVRDKRKMVKAKTVMQRDIFALGYYDPRFDADIEKNDGRFDPYTRFSREDLTPISEELPKVIQKWADERDRS